MVYEADIILYRNEEIWQGLSHVGQILPGYLSRVQVETSSRAGSIFE
jgi:hypothetical protein